MINLNNLNNEYIKKKILDRVTGIDVREGTFINDVVSPTSVQFADFYFVLSNIQDMIFVESCYGDHLDIKGKEFGVYRKKGTKAIGEVTINGGTNINIPSGSIVRTNGNLEFVTTVDAILNTTITIPIIAMEIGSKYNISEQTIISIDNISGVTFVNNEKPTLGGTDVESDDDFKERILLRMQNPPGSGNKSDYVRWAKEIPEIKYAKAIPVWNGNGTVKVIVGGEKGAPVSQEILQKVIDFICPLPEHGDGMAPVGATVTIANMESFKVNVNITGLQLESGYSLEQVKVNIEQALNEYFNNLDPGQTIRFLEVSSDIIDAPGCLDFTSLTINGVSANITTQDNQKATLGQIEYVEG